MYGGNSMILKKVLFMAVLIVTFQVSLVLGAALDVNTLDLGAMGGTLDITNAHAVIRIGDLTTQTNQILNGWVNGGAYDWAGTGINSSYAAARIPVDAATAIGVLSNDFIYYVPDFYGHNTEHGDLTGSASEILMTYTWLCDTDLDRDVDETDYFNLLNGLTLGTVGIENNSWGWGDCDYNGIVDDNDFLYGFSLSYGNTTPLSGGSGISPVPEPSTFVLLAFAGLFIALRWFRR
jgi:hypothetical protein